MPRVSCFLARAYRRHCSAPMVWGPLMKMPKGKPICLGSFEILSAVRE